MTTPVEAETSGHPEEPGAVRLSRTVPGPLGVVWQALISPEGTAIWLGEGAVLGSKGESYHCADGSSGVVRSFHPLEQLRVSWHPSDDAPPTLVELDLCADGSGTRLELCHDRLHGADEAMLRERWADRLDALARYAVVG